MNFEKRLVQFQVLMAISLLFTTAILADFGMAQDKAEKTFFTPEQASQALYTAVKNNDEKSLLEILGTAGRQILYSGTQSKMRKIAPHSSTDMKRCIVSWTSLTAR